jgi:lambda repressor-like predicted transcriptional regulator
MKDWKTMNMTHQFPIPFDFSTLRNIKGRKLPKETKLKMIKEGLQAGLPLNKISVEIGYSPSYLMNVLNKNKGFENHKLYDDLCRIMEEVNSGRSVEDQLKATIKDQQKLIAEYEEVILALVEKLEGAK